MGIETRVGQLTAVRCAECGHPVCHVDATVPGTLAGGLCTRCRRDHQGRERRVYTYTRLVSASPDVPDSDGPVNIEYTGQQP